MADRVRVGDLLDGARAQLDAEGIDDASLEAGFLLGHVLDVPVAALRASPDQRVEEGAASQFAALVDERSSGRPLAYVLGEWEFYGLEVTLTPDVLIPRPETELLVDWALELDRATALTRVADVGTGSGCLAIAIAHHLPQAEVHATDISTAALDVARTNAARHQLSDRIQLHRGDLLEPLGGKFDLIVSNPPYIAAGDPKLAADVLKHEPSLALFDTHGDDGLGFYRRFAMEVADRVHPNGHCLFEVGETQATEAAQLFDARTWAASIRPDLAGIDRAVLMTRRS